MTLGDLILGTTSRDPSWCQRRKFSSHETAGDRLFNLFRMAESLYMSGDSSQAGATFRQCFCMLEEVIRDEPIDFYQALFFNIPFRLPTEELLKVYLCHLHQLFNLKRYGEPIARMAAATHRLATEAACHLLPSIYRMHDITADYYRKIRGETDMESLEARMDALKFSEGEDKSQECNHIIGCFRELLNDTVSQFGSCSVEATFVEHWQIAAATSLAAPSDDIVRLCEDHVSRLIENNDDRRLCDWNLPSLDRYESVQYNLYKVFVESGDMERGILHLKDSILAAEYAGSRAVDHDWKASTACQLLQNQLELVDCLSVVGQVEEADGIKAMIVASEYLEEVVQNDLRENFAELLAC
ncbi:n1-acetylpolyamine oxidase [Colletotrichum asianum]